MESPAAPADGESGPQNRPQQEHIPAGRLTRDSERSLWPTLLPHLARSIAFLAPVVISLLCWLIGTGFSIVAGLGAVGGSGLSLGPAIDSGLSLLGLAGLVFFGMVWLASLFVGAREVVAEGGVLIEDGAQALAAVYGSMQVRVNRQCPPFVVRSGEFDRNPTLWVSNDREEALIIVRPSGPDLRIGWSMWRIRSTATLIGDLLPGKRSNDVAVLQADSSSAMRELLNSVTQHSARDHTS
ncbi:MAG TPA: hypothetical protein VNP03_08035 [Pseudonocardia sp.]|nr:hypothetical protein [Pseudonocardia sp.]